jgi:hypothetical protein
MLAVSAFWSASVAGAASPGQVVGLFTITGGECGRGPCTLAMSGTVTLTAASGKTYRIRVNRHNRLKRSAGQFSRSVPAGSYTITDRVSKARGGGNCLIYGTDHSLRLKSNLSPTTTVSIRTGKKTYVRINCFGH